MLDGQNLGWSAYEKLVLSGIEELKQRIAAVEEGQILIRIDVAKLKVKSGLWGAAAGTIPALGAVALILVNGG